jgi:hypothetical protein
MTREVAASRLKQILMVGERAAAGLLDRLKGKPWRTDRVYKRAMLFFLCKALKSYRAMGLLLDSGYPEDARIIGRSIYELRLQALYLAGEPEERAKQFAAHESKATWRSLRRLAASGKVRGLRIEGAQQTGIKPRQVREGDWWGDGGTRALARKVGLEAEYDVKHWLLSGYVHSSTRVLFRYWKNEQGGIQLLHRPGDAQETGTAQDATEWLLEIVLCSSRALELEYEEQITIAASALKVLR